MADLDIALIIVTYKTAQLTINALRSVAAERKTAGLKIRAIIVDKREGGSTAAKSSRRVQLPQTWKAATVDAIGEVGK
jgi:hypothetical protein